MSLTHLVHKYWPKSTIAGLLQDDGPLSMYYVTKPDYNIPAHLDALRGKAEYPPKPVDFGKDWTEQDYYNNLYIASAAFEQAQARSTATATATSSTSN